MQDVGFGYRGGPALLSNMTLSLQPGMFHFLTGPSGAGKTTLLRMLYADLLPTSGRITAFGADIGSLGRDDIAHLRRRVGVVHQDAQFLDHLPVAENVALPLEFAGCGDAFERARAQLTAVGLDHRLGHYPGQLSGGEQQRVALARAFVIEPKILLADEPTGSLDQTTGADIIELLFEMQERLGSTLILVTHAQELASRCTRIVRLADGRIDSAGGVVDEQ